MIPTFKLNSIHFREAVRADPPAGLHHYTNQAGLLGIFETGEFCATKIKYMNDATEFGYALALGKRELEKRYYALPTMAAVNPNSTEQRQRTLLQWIIDHLDALAIANICAVSFCVGS